jgi:O-antigen ligase
LISPSRSTTVTRIIEACWLGALVLVPLAILPEGTVAGAVQAPKIFLLRTITLILAVGLVFSFAAKPWAAAAFKNPLYDTSRTAFRALRANPVAFAVASVVAANLLAFAFSPVRSVSWGGVDPGFDSYGLFNMLSYFTLFLAIATHLRTPAQLLRLLWTSTAVAAAIGAYGVAQHFGFDILGETGRGSLRLTLTFGNPVFGAAYLVMTIPVALVLWETFRPRLTPTQHVALGVAFALLPVFAIAFSLSRGASISLAFALITYFALSAYVFGARSVRRPALVVGIATVLALLIGATPVQGNATTAATSGDVVDRVGSIGYAFTSEGGGLSGRYGIWETALDAFLGTPWIEDSPSELPGVGLRPLRRIIGFGQDMFGVTYRLVGGDFKLGALERNAHNFAIHSLVELGLLGLLAYAWTAAAALYVLGKIIRRFRQQPEMSLIPLLAVGLTAVFMGRLLEQMAGKAQVSDLMLMWILIGIAAAITSSGAFRAADPQTSQSSRRQVRHRATQSSSLATPSTLIPAILAILAVIFWWQGSLSDLRALALSGQAQQAGTDGRPGAAGSLYQRAIDIAPRSSIPRLLLSQGLLNSAQADPNPATALESLQESLIAIDGLLDRNPVDLRAREWKANITLEIATIEPSQLPRAVRDSQIVVALSPGRWEQLQPLAWVLALSNDFEAALENVHAAYDLGATDSPDAYLLYYIESKIERERGNDEAADIALDKLRTFTHPDVPFLVQDAQSP